eukprot:15170680-Alexandrium_andersonii.AAC.1
MQSEAWREAEEEPGRSRSRRGLPGGTWRLRPRVSVAQPGGGRRGARGRRSLARSDRRACPSARGQQ